MGKTNLIQTDFLAGEISPRMEMQNNLEGRKHGVELMKNFFPHLQGSAETSRGFEYVAALDGTSGIMFGFPVVLLTSFTVVIVGGTLWILDSGGAVVKNSKLLNEYFTKRSDSWMLSPSINGDREFLPGGVLLTNGLNPQYHSYVAQKATVVANDDYDLTVDVAFGSGPLRVKVGTTLGGSDILDTVAYGTGRKTFRRIASSTVDMYVQLYINVGDADKTLSGAHLNVTNEDLLYFACPWTTSSEIASVQAHMVPEKTSMVITSADYPPYLLELVGDTWTFAAMTLTAAPAIWAAGNYPPAAGFHGGRLWLGGAASEPSKMWGSKSANYGNFTLGTLDDDALEFTLGRSGAICWIAGGPGLLVGTSNAEHVISSEGGVITPSDKYFQIQSTNGSYPTQALEVGNEVMYISPDGRKIRSIGFEWLKDAWRSRDITHASEHMTEGDGVLTQLRYSPNPDSLIIGLTKGGELVVSTYEPYTQTAGFSRRTTDGTIVSIATAPFNGSDELWALVHRGGGVLRVEKERHPDNVKLDSYTRFQSATAISGGTAPQLADKSCQVLVDGAVHPNVTPNGSGVFTTEYSGSVIHIGLKIDSIIRTLPVADDVANIGTTRTMKKRFTEVWVRILDSWKPLINGVRPPDRRPATPMGNVEPAATESIRVSNDGWDMDAKITIEQDLPLKTEIAGWFGRIIQEEI